MNTTLGDVAAIQSGIYAPELLEDGQAAYLQAKHFDDRGGFLANVDSFVPQMPKPAHLLRAGDLLLTAKGNRHFAWLCPEGFAPAVASSIFFVLRPDASKAAPGYLAALLNSHRYLLLLQALSAGSSIPSIRKSELAALPLPLPPLGVQQRIAQLRELYLQESGLLQEIIKEKKYLYEGIVQKLTIQVTQTL